MKKQGIDQCMTRVAKVCARGGDVHDQSMENAHVGQGVLNHEKLQSLVLIGVQTSEKMLKRHFIKHLACTL